MRQADLNFYECLKANEFGDVLNSRQMGKSSLRVRTMQRLPSDSALGHRGAIKSVTFSPDGKIFASASEDKLSRI